MKMLCGITVVGLALLLMAAPGARASDKVDGNWLLRDCRESLWLSEGRTLAQPSLMGASFCGGYVSGLLEMHMIQTSVKGMPPLFCHPERMESVQAIRILVRYLESHPERLHWIGAALVTFAMDDAFPCPPAASRPQR